MTLIFYNKYYSQTSEQPLNTYASGQNSPLFGGVRFSEVCVKRFTFFFAMQTYSDKVGEEIGYV